VIYCSSDDCESAETVWIAMRSWAFPMQSVRVFHPGWAGIQAAKLPTASGPDLLQDDVPSDADAAEATDSAGDPAEPQDADTPESDRDAARMDEGETP
jgi:hypothetical protein